MTQLSEKIWQRDSAREIMREARKNFRIARGQKGAVAYTSLASAHYSLAGRYKEHFWQYPMAAWHMFAAASHAIYAANIIEQVTIRYSSNEADVISRILARVPAWLGGDKLHAKRILYHFLDTPTADILPHTKALMFITLGEIEWKQGSKTAARDSYRQAKSLVTEIEREDSEDRKKQLVRVVSAIGFFEYDHGPTLGRYFAKKVIKRTLDLARQVSKDQERKILAECRKRGI